MSTNIPVLFDLLQAKGITAKKLSEDTGISTGNISDWKSGRAKPSADKLQKLAAYFNVSTDYLLGNDNKTNDPATDKQLKFALFGDTEIDDDVLDDIKRLAKMHVELKRQKDKK